eukprot:TRINITY_DN18521_c0_g1_i1.p1 TRINITY_DN18521_c0_g1~~TRINITY_DN18521_c0_g1_i1.p1  ORF type:complete len:372 (+),score=78.75 TRINITY_DN18521_c0_g1_i1:81-1118(+)
MRARLTAAVRACCSGRAAAAAAAGAGACLALYNATAAAPAGALLRRRSTAFAAAAADGPAAAAAGGGQKGVVVVTGCCGRVGREVVKEMSRRGWTVRGLDMTAPEESPYAEDPVFVEALRTGGFTRSALQSADEVAVVCQGARALVHLAAHAGEGDFMQHILPANIVAVYSVLHAAASSHVSRVVIASSGAVYGRQKSSGPWPCRASDRVSPVSWYGVAKVMSEVALEMCCEAPGSAMQGVAVRLALCPHNVQDKDLLDRTGARSYISPSDAGNLFATAVEHPLPSTHRRFYVVNGTGRPTVRNGEPTVPGGEGLFSRDEARQLLGFEPQHMWPEGSDHVTETNA